MDRIDADAGTLSANVAIAGTQGVRHLSRAQWRSGIAAWLGWTFDGLDMHLYILVAAPFVAQLLGGLSTADPRVGRYSSIIQGGFLLGWALGGGFFGRIGDRLGRARALSLTVLTYALFTGVCGFASSPEQITALRFIAALGMGGEPTVWECACKGYQGGEVNQSNHGSANSSAENGNNTELGQLLWQLSESLTGARLDCGTPRPAP